MYQLTKNIMVKVFTKNGIKVVVNSKGETTYYIIGQMIGGKKIVAFKKKYAKELAAMKAK